MTPPMDESDRVPVTPRATPDQAQMLAVAAKAAAPAFAAANWKWHSWAGEQVTPFVPSESQIEDRLHDLLGRILASSEPEYSARCGRLEVYRVPDSTDLAYGVNFNLGVVYEDAP